MNYKKYFDIINSNELFKDISNTELENLFNSNKLSLKKYTKKQIIYFENQECKTFDILLYGKISVQKLDENGNILTITNFNPGDSFGGHMIFADNNYYPMNLISKTNSIVLNIKKSLVIELCQKNKHFLSEMLRSISNKTIIISNKINDISLKTIRKSIINYLKYEYQLQNSYTLNIEMTKKEWAEKIGVQRPSLSRELMKMKREGLISYDRNSITIKEKKILF